MNKVHTDINCVKCNHNETMVWGHEYLHYNDRVCLNCRFIMKGCNVRQPQSLLEI